MEKIKKYIIDDKKLMEEWDWEKNKELDPNKISRGSDKKAWWICSKCGFEWDATINSRTQGHGCRSCSKLKKINGELIRNDIGTAYSYLLKEWNYEKNDVDPFHVLVASDKKIWWKCSKCGYEWQATAHNRCRRKSGCPVCANKRIVYGMNDLETLRPNLMKEWDYENNKISPKEISVGTNIKVWWKCSKGHRWEASVSNRAKQKNTGCPICDSERKVSLPEKVLVFYLKKVFKDLIESYKPVFMKRGELDIYIPSLKLAIEYDGERFHQNIERDIKKNNLCMDYGIKLLRIREPKCPILPSNVWFYIRTGIYEDTIEEMVCDVINMIQNKFGTNIKLDVNYDRDRMIVLKSFSTIEKKNSFVELFPELAKEWNYEKNININPKMFSKASNRKVWWKCTKCGFEWETKINSRTSLGTGCPKCCKQKQVQSRSNNDLMKKGSLKDNNPQLAKEWNYNKNKDLTPNEIIATSHKKVWWKCSKGHEWIASIIHRNLGTGCPYCKKSCKKKVKNIDTGETFLSLSDAAKSCGLKTGDPISCCCRGKQKTARGYRWKFIE